MLFLWEQSSYLCVSENATCVCACVFSVLSAHHDDQENVLEVVPEAQRGAAEQSEVSLQELWEQAHRRTSV